MIASMLAHNMITPIAHPTASTLTKPPPDVLLIRSSCYTIHHSSDLVLPLYGLKSCGNHLVVINWTVLEVGDILSPLLLLVLINTTVLTRDMNCKMCLWKTPAPRQKFMTIVLPIMIFRGWNTFACLLSFGMANFVAIIF